MMPLNHLLLSVLVVLSVTAKKCERAKSKAKQKMTHYIADGYMDRPSYDPGEVASVFVNGDGKYTGAKLYLYTVNNVAVDSVTVNMAPQSNSASNTAPWENGYDYAVSFTYTIPSFLKSGMYHWENKIFFIVKSASKTADITIVYPSNTEAAYNGSGGKCLYDNIPLNSVRSYVVSFLRPLSQECQYQQKTLSSAFLEWFTSSDYSVQMISDQDMDDYTEIQGSKILAVIGHSEYWTREARLNFDQFVDNGKDAVILSGNTMWWQVRYSADKTQMICYKDMDLDTISDPLLKTYKWPEPALNYPVLNSIGVDWPRGGYGAETGFHGWGGYKILLPESPLLNGTGLNGLDVLSCSSREFDGALFAGFNANGDPVLDTVSLGFCKIELIGYDWGVSVSNPSPAKGYGTFIAFKKSPTSGNVINVASCNWCSRFQAGIQGGFGKDVGKVQQITLNMFNLLLAHENIYATPVDSSCVLAMAPSPPLEGDFEIFPVPSRGILNVRYTPKASSWADLNGIKIEIYNTFGIIVLQQWLDVQLATEFNFKALSSGTYFVRISSSKGSRIQKIVVSNEK